MAMQNAYANDPSGYIGMRRKNVMPGQVPADADYMEIQKQMKMMENNGMAYP